MKHSQHRMPFLSRILFISALTFSRTYGGAEWSQEQLSYDFYVFEPFTVSGNEYNFDMSWDLGLVTSDYDYWSTNEVEPGVTGGGSDSEFLGPIPTNGNPPYNQTTNRACMVATTRNIINTLKPFQAKTEAQTARSMTDALSAKLPDYRLPNGVSPVMFRQDGVGGPQEFIRTLMNGPLNEVGLHMNPSRTFDGYAEFRTEMQRASANGEIIAAAIHINAGELAPTNVANHVVMMEPVFFENGDIMIRVTNSDSTGNANVYNITTNEAADLIGMGDTNDSGEPRSGHLYTVST